MPNEESTTPLMTLLAESAIALTCCSPRPRRPTPSAGANGVSDVTGLLVNGIGVRSAVLYERFESAQSRPVKKIVSSGPHHFLAISPIPIQPYRHFPQIR